MLIKKLFTALLLFITLSQTNFSFDTLTVKEIGPGVIYYKLADTARPLSINVIKVDLKNENNYIDSFIPFDTLGFGGLTATQMSQYLSKKGKNIIAAVNADFFGGEPIQAQNSVITSGKLIKGANLNRSLLLIDENKNPLIDRLVFNGELKFPNKNYTINGFNFIKPDFQIILVNQNMQNYQDDFHPYKYRLKLDSNLVLNKELTFQLCDGNSKESSEYILLSKNPIKEFIGINTVVIKLYFEGINNNIFTITGGLPGLYKNSKLIHNFFGVENLQSERFINKNPRTAVGYNKTKDTLTIVTVDGRQPNHSMGLNLYELSRLMLMLGCTDALNLDGGGSTAMVIRDSLVNKPSDLTGERTLYSMLMVLSKTKSEKSLIVTPKFKEIMQNHSIDFNINIFDEWGFQTEIDYSQVKLSVNGIEASYNNKFEFYPKTSGIAELIWEYKNLSDTTKVVVIPGE